MPWVASGSTIFPSWYHRTCMSSSTNEAMHWNGRLSPWKTIWCWDGVIWKEGSSRGASKTERKTLVSHRWLLCAKADINEWSESSFFVVLAQATVTKVQNQQTGGLNQGWRSFIAGLLRSWWRRACLLVKELEINGFELFSVTNHVFLYH